MIDAGQGKKAINVKSVRLDDYFADAPEGLDVIKIDTEGAEAIILQGMLANILRKNRTLRLVMEYSPRLLKASGHEPDEVLTKLIDQEFEIQFFEDAGGALVDLSADSTSRLTGTLEKQNLPSSISFFDGSRQRDDSPLWVFNPTTRPSTWAARSWFTARSASHEPRHVSGRTTNPGRRRPTG